ncbi:MAG: hypothetical protein AAF489_06340 [Bacteroidota bacterium]
MKRIFRLAEHILAHPVTNILLAIMFLYSGITEAMEDYHSKETGLKVHHGVALYGLILFVKSFVAILKSLKWFHR